MPKKKCALRKGVTKWPILEESVANWVLENRLNGLILTRKSVRLLSLKWSKKNAFSCYPTMKVHKDTLNSRRAASPLVRIVVGEEKWKTPNHLQSAPPQNWGEPSQILLEIQKSNTGELEVSKPKLWATPSPDRLSKKGSEGETATGTSLTSQEVYSNERSKIAPVRLTSGHLKCLIYYDSGRKIRSTCKKGCDHPASPYPILRYIGLPKDYLTSDPFIIIVFFGCPQPSGADRTMPDLSRIRSNNKKKQ
ncbi:hypothetical protein TNCV_451891 [Trichonephila clavipes]|nr:hypothetical protein TNCV_451891 [Trichonephila clavipes]